MSGVAFSTRVADPAWLAAALDWIEDALAVRGHRLTGPARQVRIRPWSTQVTVRTDAGRMWFKENCAPQRHEPGLQAALAEWLPDAFDAPIAIAPGRMVTRDRGDALADLRPPAVADWTALVVEAAHVQQVVASRREEVLALGVPDCSPATTLARFDQLLRATERLEPDHPAHLDTDAATRLHGARGRVADAVEQLESSALPTTWNHGDLHASNAFEVDGRLRLFDLGDSQWTHALEILSVPYGIAQQAGLDWTPLVGAYVETWGTTVDGVQRDWHAAAITQAVHRAWTWWTCLAEATAEEWQQWGDGVTHHLGRVLAW